jgi:hypothetical protein
MSFHLTAESLWVVLCNSMGSLLFTLAKLLEKRGTYKTFVQSLKDLSPFVIKGLSHTLLLIRWNPQGFVPPFSGARGAASITRSGLMRQWENRTRMEQIKCHLYLEHHTGNLFCLVLILHQHQTEWQMLGSWCLMKLSLYSKSRTSSLGWSRAEVCYCFSLMNYIIIIL